MDVEQQAIATYVAAAFEDLGQRERRQLWAALRGAVATTRGADWQPPSPYAEQLAELAARMPRRRTTLLGRQRGGVTNREQGGTRVDQPPWTAPVAASATEPAEVRFPFTSLTGGSR